VAVEIELTIFNDENRRGAEWSIDNRVGRNQLSGLLSLTAGKFKCDQMLTADTVINTPLGSPAVLIIENGQLDLNGHALTTSNGSAVTLVFSGDNSGSYSHMPADNTNGTGGRLDLAAPTSGPWSGVAIYQDPNLTSGLDVSRRETARPGI